MILFPGFYLTAGRELRKAGLAAERRAVVHRERLQAVSRHFAQHRLGHRSSQPEQQLAKRPDRGHVQLSVGQPEHEQLER